MKKKALITGVTGQDGAYLAEFLLKRGYEVHGLKRRSSSFNTSRIDHLYQDRHAQDVVFKLHYGDLTDSTNLIRLIQEIQPDEVYNLAAQSHVKVSFETPEYTANADAIGALRILEAIRLLNLGNKTKFYQASTSELYGLVQAVPQSETTPFYPRSPYAVAKLYAYWITINYREAYNIFACNGILFNHESPIRGETFVTRKITLAVANLLAGRQKQLYLGNLDAQRDWGHAKDYVQGMYLMMQQEKPSDFVLATGITTTVRNFVQLAFEKAGIQLAFKEKGVKEYAVIAKIDPTMLQKFGFEKTPLQVGDVVVSVDPAYYRPTEVDLLIGDATKAQKLLGWKPAYTLDELVEEMVVADIDLIKKEIYLNAGGFKDRSYFE